MSDRGWDDDSGYHDAVRRAERVARFGWAAIGGTVGALGCALIAAAVVCAVAVAAFVYLVVARRLLDDSSVVVRPGRWRPAAG